MKKILLILAATLTLTNCSPAIKQEASLVYVPPAPYLPSVSDTELQCLADQTYERLAKRDLTQRLYTEQLKALLK